MEKLKKKPNKLLIVLLVIIVLAGGYFVFSGGSDDTSGNLLTATFADMDIPAEQEIVSLLLKLRSIELKGDLFERDDFDSLVDFGVELQDEPVGRDNPFAPIGTIFEEEGIIEE